MLLASIKPLTYQGEEGRIKLVDLLPSSMIINASSNPPPLPLPLTRCDVCTYGDFLDRATWMDAGPHSMKLALLRSRIRCKLL